MSIRLHRRLAQLAIVGVCPFAVACVLLVSNGTDVKPVDKGQGPVTVRSAVKAHLSDGSTIVYRDGIIITERIVYPRKGGGANRFSALLTPMTRVEVPLDSVMGLETYTTRTNAGATLVLSTLGTAAASLGAVALGIAIFGSCPTIYADSAGTAVLQAEVFATRVSPLLEARDIDLLSARPDSDGRLTLEIRNEALETHYINHLELLEVRHASGQRLIPDEHGKPLLVTAFQPLASARDRAGRDVRAALARTDGLVFETDSTILARASGTDPYDYLDLTIARPPGDSAVIGLELRNSLLNTVLLYDLMLAAPGARSLDWLAQDMQRIGPMLRFGRWYREHFGLRVSVWDGARYREIERHPTYGPVAWREAATVIPVLEQDSLRVRLRFAADEWRIDWIGVAPEFTRPRTRTIAIARIRATNDSIAADTRRNLRSADERYVQTSPGERFWATFATGPHPRDSARTFLLASQGYYSEWIRSGWVKSATDTNKFAPSSDALHSALRRWAAQRDTLDKAFYSTKVPMRSQ